MNVITQARLGAGLAGIALALGLTATPATAAAPPPAAATISTTTTTVLAPDTFGGPQDGTYHDI